MLNSLVTQWLGLHASTAGATGLIPVQGTGFLQAAQCGQKKKKKRHVHHFTPLPRSVATPGVALISVLAPWNVMGDVVEWAVLTLNSLFAAATCLLVTFVIFKLWFFKHLVVEQLTC